jgi:hypothetical protein
MENWVKTPVTRDEEGLQTTVRWDTLTNFASDSRRRYFCYEDWGQAYANAGSYPDQQSGGIGSVGRYLGVGQHIPSNEERSICRSDGHQKSTECSESSTDTKCATPSTTIHDHVSPSAADQAPDGEDRSESGELGIGHRDAIWES